VERIIELVMIRDSMLQLSSNVFSLMDIGDVISFLYKLIVYLYVFCVVFIFYYFLCVLRVRFYIKLKKINTVVAVHVYSVSLYMRCFRHL